MIRLLAVEMRRDLARRLVVVLVAIGVAATFVVGLVVAANSSPPGPAGSFAMSETFALVDLWSPDGDGEAILAVPIIFLAIGGMLAGASTVGAEWRAGTIGTLLTWESRRVRVAVAKLVAAAVLAFAIATALLSLFVAVLWLVASTQGSTEGADAAWARALVGGMVRGGGLVALTAGLGASIAMIGRNTAAALGAGFAYLLVGENIMRAWKPWTARWLFGENATAFLLWRDIDHPLFSRGPATAGLTLAGYLLAIAVVAVVLFRTRDVASV